MIGGKSIYEFISDKKAKREEPGIEKIFDVEFKGKADLISNDIILDFKTTDNVKRFPQAVKFESSYDTQAFIYQSIFKLPLVFIAVGNIKKHERMELSIMRWAYTHLRTRYYLGVNKKLKKLYHDTYSIKRELVI